MDSFSSSFPKVPIFWIDNNNFIFTRCNCAINLPTIQIRKINIHNLSNKIISEINNVPPAISNLGYPKGIKIWNNINNTWTSIDNELICDMIGWIEKEK